VSGVSYFSNFHIRDIYRKRWFFEATLIALLIFFFWASLEEIWDGWGEILAFCLIVPLCFVRLWFLGKRRAFALFLLYFLIYYIFFFTLHFTRPHEAGSLPTWVPIFHIGMMISSYIVFLLMLYVAADKDPPTKTPE
jgi:hypothetical protein